MGVMLGVNSILAAYELALASVRRERLQHLIDEHRPGAADAMSMKNRIERSLAAVQLGITLAGAIAAATGGAGAERSVSPWLSSQFGLSESIADVVAVTFVVIPLAAVTIVASELVPKVFALNHTERVVLALSPAIRFVAWAGFPAVWCLESLTRLFVLILTRFIPLPPTDERAKHMNELRAQVSLLRASQVIGMEEERIILHAARLSSITVGEIMMAREDIVALHVDATLGECLAVAHLDLHTRFPVTERKGDPDAIIGYVTFKEMTLLAKSHPHHPSLREITRPVIRLPQSMPANEALKRMMAEHLHFALVTDDEGSVAGMITQEDLLEELVGDIQDEFDRLPRHVSQSGRQWVVGGGATLGRLRYNLQLPDLGTGLPDACTVSDWLLRGRTERIKGGDAWTQDHVRILVRKVRRRKVTEAVLDPLPRIPAPAPDRHAAGATHTPLAP
jgi:putative hemolysin